MNGAILSNAITLDLDVMLLYDGKSGHVNVYVIQLCQNLMSPIKYLVARCVLLRGNVEGKYRVHCLSYSENIRVMFGSFSYWWFGKFVNCFLIFSFSECSPVC